MCSRRQLILAGGSIEKTHNIILKISNYLFFIFRLNCQMDLIALAIAPGFAICLYIFHRDAYNREPKLNLLVSFILGAAIVIPVAFTEIFLSQFPDNTIAGVAVNAFIAVALTEELGKFMVLRFYAYPRKSFDEPLDGIVYGVMIGMGFATLENILYVQKYGIETGFLRMILSVPAHATFGVLMGYQTGKAKFDSFNKNRLLSLGLVWAVLFHGLFDFFLFLQGNPYTKNYISDLLLFAGAVVSFVIAIRLSLKHIKQHRLLSQQTYNPLESMIIRKAYPADVPLIRHMAHEIWPQTYGDILSKDQLTYMLELIYNENTLKDQMAQGVEFILVYDGVHPAGFASFSMIEPQVYKLHKIYVLPSQQGKGTGSFIIGQLEKAMKQKGATSLQLNVNRHNNAKLFYEKLGFVVIREEDIDIGNGYFMNDYVMEKKFEV
jgi:RsiW-degrading membrane proteinase PrsW (M82 family)/ribosomal protein S18 acetylase RimI-like enzyme